MPLIILLLILAVPVIELSVLIDVGGEIGALPAVGLCILTAAIGLSIVRLQGMKIFADAQVAARSGQPVGASLVHGFFLALAGIFLFIPGFITDFFGALLLIPPVRLVLGRALMSRFIVKTSGTRPDQSTVIIEGEYWSAEPSDTDPTKLGHIDRDGDRREN